MLSGFNNALKGKPDDFLTIGLVIVGLVALWFAVAAPPAVKATALAWFIFP